MRRCSYYLVVAMVLAVFSTSPAVSDSYFIYNQYGGTWHDANKTAANTEDDLLCWAATASNILSWGNWGASLYRTEAQIFQHIQDHWTDNTGQIWWAYKWWLDGSWPPTSLQSIPDVPGGGNFYPSLAFSNYYNSAQGGDLMVTIDSLLHQGKGVGLMISKSTSLHAVTAWGYSYSAPGSYTSIFITDSDDGYLGLREYPLVWQTDAWYLGGSYNGWKISNVQALGYLHTPIAPSWVLFGTGVFSLLLLRRRRRPDKQKITTL